MNFEVKLVQSGKANDYTQPKYSARFGINSLKLKIRKQQFDSMVEIEKVIEQYQKLQYTLYAFIIYYSEDTRKYKQFRPLYSILSKSIPGTLKDKYKNENAVLWWKYAIECTIRVRREKKGKGQQFRISDQRLQQYNRDFSEFYTMIVLDKELQEKERLKYNNILYTFPLQQLKL